MTAATSSTHTVGETRAVVEDRRDVYDPEALHRVLSREIRHEMERSPGARLSQETGRLVVLDRVMTRLGVTLDRLVELRGSVQVHADRAARILGMWEKGATGITSEDRETVDSFLEQRWFAPKELFRFLKFFTRKLRLGKKGIERMLDADGFEGNDLKSYLTNLSYGIGSPSGYGGLHLQAVRSVYESHPDLRMKDVKAFLDDLFAGRLDSDDTAPGIQKHMARLYRGVVVEDDEFDDIVLMKRESEARARAREAARLTSKKRKLTTGEDDETPSVGLAPETVIPEAVAPEAVPPEVVAPEAVPSEVVAPEASEA